MILKKKGLTETEINKYIDWRWCNKTITSINQSIKKTGDDIKKINKLQEKIKKIEKYKQRNFKFEDISRFSDVLYYNSVRRRSPRKKSAKQQADYNEIMIMENDNELLDDIETWCEMKKKKENINPEILRWAQRMLLYYFVIFFFVNLEIYNILNRIEGLTK